MVKPPGSLSPRAWLAIYRATSKKPGGFTAFLKCAYNMGSYHGATITQGLHYGSTGTTYGALIAALVTYACTEPYKGLDYGLGDYCREGANHPDGVDRSSANAAYGAVSRQVGRILDEVVAGKRQLGKGPDCPTAVTWSQYTKEISIYRATGRLASTTPSISALLPGRRT